MTTPIERSLAASDLLGTLDETARAHVITELEHVRLLGGQVLFRQGDRGDCLYVVAYGRLRATVERHGGVAEFLGEIGRGETVGEMALLTGEARSATVRAARDSELYKLSGDAFNRLLERHPHIIMQLTRRIVLRYTSMMRSRAPGSTPATIALVPAGRETPLGAVSRKLERALAGTGSVLRVDSDLVDGALGGAGSQLPSDQPGDASVLAWLNEQESRYQFIIYEGNALPSAWSQRCVRYADRILVIANAEEPTDAEFLDAGLYGARSDATAVRKELVLVHRKPRAVYAGAANWLRTDLGSTHHHVALDSEADFDRLARFLTGRARGVVLGGGGARGFAHIGVLRALEESGLPIDVIGGASMGAYMAAQFALGWNHERMRAYNREVWLRIKPMQDYTLPLLSLLTGRGFRNVASDICGDVSIEDLATRFFCVSSNLTRATVKVHQRGSLCRAIVASISVPGLLPPVRDEGDLLVDGAILNNVPIDVMRRLCEGTVIASDVSPVVDLAMDVSGDFPQTAWGTLREMRRNSRAGRKTPTIVDVLSRVSTLSSTITAQALQKQATLYLHLPTESFTVVDWKRVEEMIETGYRYAAAALEAWIARGEGVAPEGLLTVSTVSDTNRIVT